MPVELQIITAREFVRVGAHGKLDWNESRAALAKLARSCLERGIDRALLDVRDVKSDMTQDELSLLVHAFREVGFKDHHRLAVLYHEDPDARARLFAFFAADRGWDVRAFDTFEEAVDWLAIAEEADADVGLDLDVEVDDPSHKKTEPPEPNGG